MAFCRTVVALLAIVATASGAGPVASSQAKAQKMAAVEKALALLTNLQQQVLKEGEEEAKTYDKFSCFCSDTTKEKLEAIQKGEDTKEALTSDIQALEAKRGAQDVAMKEADTAIRQLEEEMAAASSQRTKELQVYQENSADLRAALEALSGALKVLKASKPASFLQTRGGSKGLLDALRLADAMGLGGQPVTKLTSALVQGGEVPLEDYQFRSDSVIATLEDLQTKFREERTKVDEAEVESVNLHKKLVQENSDLVKQARAKLETAKKTKGEAIADISSTSQRLSTTSATLLGDKKYAEELSKMCSTKAKTWDQRSKMRADELQVLTQAIDVVKNVVSAKTTGATIRFAQQGVSLRRARAVAHDPAAMEAIEAAAESEEAPRPVSFLAVARRQRGAGAEPEAGRAAVESLLRTRGVQLKSTLLTALASHIAEDPFAKVKTLIQELIERLQKESTNEANQKGWCDKSIAEAKQKRQYAAAEVSTLNGKLATLEVLRRQLTSELAALAAGIKELKDGLAEAEKLRAEEKAENAAVVEEAKEGLQALNTVIELLDQFYKTAAKAEASFLQRASPEEDVPDAGFESGEVYTGAQGEAGGILGMLTVMKSDFARTVTETEAAEKQAEQDHLEFKTESGKSVAEKEVAQTEKTRQRDDAAAKFDEAKANLDVQMTSLKTSIKELIELQPACINTGMTYQERVSRREEEIAALQQALCILDAYSKYGPDGVAGACS